MRATSDPSAAAAASSSDSRARACSSAASTLGPSGADLLLVGDLGLELDPQHDQVVGEQPQPRVTQLGLHAGSPAGDLGLLAQRLELAAQLAGQVGQPGEVHLHRLELAQRLFLALAVLEDAGSLLDEASPVLGPGLQHRVQLPLPDDDVHLPADPGVGEQLLDVQQPSTLAVDLVLACALAEHPPGDRHFGELDRQRVVGVVDR